MFKHSACNCVMIRPRIATDPWCPVHSHESYVVWREAFLRSDYHPSRVVGSLIPPNFGALLNAAANQRAFAERMEHDA